MDGSKQEIMDAVYTVLCREGYQALSVQNIADELGKGKSYIYHYYSDKRELMNSFLDYILGGMEQASGSHSELSSAERFDRMLDDALAVQKEEIEDFRKAVMEMKAQTPHKEEYAEKFREMDKLMITEFSNVLDANGVESPEVKAELLVSTLEGLIDRKVGYSCTENLDELKTELKNQYVGGENFAAK